MSVQAMSWVLDHSESTLAARLVLLSIANHADSEGRNAFPSQATIGREARVSERTVRRCVDELVAIGELAVKHHRGMFGRGGRTNYYEMPAFQATLGSADNLTGVSRKGGHPDRKGRTSTTEGRTYVAAEPSLEPSDEPGAPLDMKSMLDQARRALHPEP